MGEKTYPVTIHKGLYHDGNVAVTADWRGESFCTLSVNLPESKWLPKDAWYGKHWSENDGFLPQLMAQGIIEEVPATPAASGFVDNIRAYRLK